VTGLDVLTLGETMASARSTGSLRGGSPLALSIAGAESNVAIGLARLGHRTGWLGRLGADELGELVLRTLRAEGVDISRVVRDPSAPTGAMFSETVIGDVGRVLYYRTGSAGSRLSAADVAALPVPRILHVTGITPALSGSAREAVDSAVAAARAAGATISLDVNYRSKLWDADAARAVLVPLAESADVIVASADELGLVADGADTEEQAQSLLAGAAREVVVKLGADGALAVTAAGSWQQAAYPARVVDTIGAGDAFTAGYLSALLDGLDIEDRLRRGCVLGAFAVSGRGDWELLPARGDLALLERGETSR
jgi:2-dehydro-3-deoxygluconokinase